jgi:preprotein translocase subunit YajC
MITIAELQLLACVPVVIIAGFVFYWIRKKRRENKKEY